MAPCAWKFLQYKIFMLGKQIGFLRITYPQLFTVFTHSTKYISMYFIILRMEGQILCLAKHYSTENRELTLPELISAVCSTGNTRISTETPWETSFAPLCLNYIVQMHENAWWTWPNSDAQQLHKDLLDL